MNAICRISQPSLRGTSRRLIARILFLQIGFLLIGGCGFPERPKIISISKASVFKPSSPKEVHSLEQAMAAIITACRDDLGLPVVDPLEMYLYKNKVSFALYGFGWRTLPTDVRGIAAFAKKNEIHVNLETPVAVPWGSWLETLAHEYGHNIQYEATEDHGYLHDTSPWILEGFGQWIAARVLHSLKWQDYDISVHQATRELLRQGNQLPRLFWLNDPQNWKISLNEPYGSIKTYQLAFIAVHQMLQSQQTSKSLEYLTKGHYGTLDIQAKLDSYLSSLASRNHAVFSTPKPQWKIGDRWRYKRTTPGRADYIEREVTGETVFNGIPSYKLRVGKEDNVYSKTDLGMLASFKGDKLVTRRNKPNKIFSWPLESGKEWRNAYYLEDLEKQAAFNLDRAMVILGLEKTVVPAGAFNAVKIEAYDYESGRLDTEYWYSAETRSVIKFRSYTSDQGFTEDELVSFKIQ
jgi:hypothetical protein